MNIAANRLLPGVLAAAAGLGLATSCVSTERETTAPGRATRTTYTPPRGKGQRVTAATVLNTVQATHVFSAPGAPDRFMLLLQGPRVLTGRLHFVVLSAQGDTLHREYLPARLLQDPQALTVRDQEISVLRGMNAFFSANRFVVPAIPATTQTAPPGLTAAAWSSLKASPQAVGFDYPSAQGSLQRLVYVPQLGRAVVLAE